MSAYCYYDPPGSGWFRWNSPGMSREDAYKASESIMRIWQDVVHALTPPLACQWAWDEDSSYGTLVIHEADDESQNLTMSIKALVELGDTPLPAPQVDQVIGRAEATISPRRRPTVGT